MNKTLYNITQQDAKKLVDYCNGDVIMLATALYNTNKAPTLERGLYKAKKIIVFSRGK